MHIDHFPLYKKLSWLKKTLRYLPNYKKHFKKCGYSKVKYLQNTKNHVFFKDISINCLCDLKKSRFLKNIFSTYYANNHIYLCTFLKFKITGSHQVFDE